MSISSGPILTASKGMPVYRLQCVMALTLKHQGVVVQRVDQPGFDDVPPGADVGEVLQTLIALYPGLRAFVASDKRPLKQHFSVAPAPGKLFLFSSHA